MIRLTRFIFIISLFCFNFYFSCGSKKDKQTKTPEFLEQAEFFDTTELQESRALYVSEPVDSLGSLKILSHGPVGETKGQVQIRIDFGSPLILLTTLSDQERAEVLKHFRLEPTVKGNFRLLGTSTVVFEPETSLPMASRYRVTVRKGLTDIQGQTLEQDYSWEFQTPMPRIQIYPGNNAHHIKIDQDIYIYSSVGLNFESLKSHLQFQQTVSEIPVKFELLESEQNPKEGEDIGMHRVRYDYIMDPFDDLKKDTQYTVRILPGLITRRGNLPTEKEIAITFRTFPPFRFENSGFCDFCGRKITTVPYLSFSNNPFHEKLEEYIEINPATENMPFHPYGCKNYSIGINDFQLEPNTSYTVTIKKGLKDIYGQELENPQRITFVTGELTPQMWGPSGYQLITPNIEPTLGIKTVNINTAFYKLFPLRPQDILVQERLEYYGSIKNLVGEIKKDDKQIDIPLNESAVGKSYFDLKPHLRGENFGVVAYSFRSPMVQCFTKPIEFNGLILRTNIGIYSQFHPTVGIIKLNQLTDGEPIGSAKIRIYREDDLPRLDKIWDLITREQGKSMKPCYEGITDDNGVLMLSAEEIARCTKRRLRNKIINQLYPPEADPDDILYDQQRFGFAEPPRLLIIAEKGDDWTFLQTQRSGYPSVWQFGVRSDWEAERPISRGTIFSDHLLYRPGDTVKMKGIARYLLYGKLMNGKGQKYNIKVVDPYGSDKQIGKVTVSDFGTFHFEVPTKKGQRLGIYSVVAETPYRGLRFTGSFRLAEFRVPEFEVKMDLDKNIVMPGDPVEVSWEGKFYFGAPMADVSSSLNVTRRKSYFRPKGWNEYSFGIPEYLREKKVALSGAYLRETIQLNKEGFGKKTIKLKSDDIPFPMTYLCDAEVEDVSKQTISANRSFTALPDHRLIGLKLSKWIVAKKSEVNVSVIVSSPEGKALANIPITVKLIKKEYHSIKTKTPDNRYTTERNIIKKEIEIKQVQSGTEPVEIAFTPQEAGSYFIWAELSEEPESGTAAATFLWVAGEDYVPWEDKGEDKLEIIMDKTEYQVGDEAVAFIQSPFPEAELFLTVSREKIFLQETKRIKGSAYTYKFRISEEMLPNAYVGAALFRLGDPIVDVAEEVGKHIERIGFAGFQVGLSSKYLDLAVTPDRDKVRPAEELSVDIQVNRIDKVGHRSELTVMVVDEAVLSLTGYRLPDMVKTVYQTRGLSARVNDNRPFIITEEALMQKGTGYGGGVMGALTGPRVRKEFLKVAYYHPNLVTDESGRATFKFKLPDNLTTWRIMAVAVGEEDLFGYQDEKVVVTQPFITRAVLPRFTRIGDQFLSGVAITNLTDAPGEVKVGVEISGKPIRLGDSPAELQGVKINPGESKAILFPFQSTSKGQSQLKFTSYFDGIFNGKSISETDALQLPLEAQEPEATETVVAVGETRKEALQKIKIGDNVRMDMGGLQFLLSSTALTNVGQGASYLVSYPYGCLEQTLSQLLALLQLKFLSDKYGFILEAAKPVDKVIDANIRKVLLLQNTDGGFKFWTSSDGSDCYLSPYTAYLFKRSRQLGYDIPQEAVGQLIAYLDKILRNPCFPYFSWKAMAEYRINVLMGLHYLDRKDQTYFEEYYNRRDQLSYGAQIHLAYLLYQSVDWRNEALRMLEEIKNGMFITAQTAYLESPMDLPPSWLFMYSPIITTAEALKLFLALEPQSEYIAKLSRYILNARKKGRWRNTYENAKAIDALVEISLKREAEPPDFVATINMAAKEVVKHNFKGYQYKPREHFIPISELPGGRQDLQISKKGKGMLYYVFSYQYRLKGPQKARGEGFRIKRTVKHKANEEVLTVYDKDPPKPINLKAGDILEIELAFSVPQTSYHLVIDDPIPAGLEAIDVSLKTTSSRYERPGQQRVTRGRDDAYGYRHIPINHTELRDNRVGLFADAVRPGDYTYTYLLRATTSGTFFWPAAKISLMYEPEQFGSSAEGMINIK